MKESELVPETVALVETSVGEFDALAVALEVLIPEKLSVADESESIAGPLEDEVAEDEIPLSIEFENVEGAELVVKAEVGEEGLELSGDIEDEGEVVPRTLVIVEGGLSAELVDTNVVLDVFGILSVLAIEELTSDELELPGDVKDVLEVVLRILVVIESWLPAEIVDTGVVVEAVELLSVLVIEELIGNELDEPVPKPEMELIDAGPEDDVLDAIELVGVEAGLALDVELVDMIGETEDVKLDVVLEETAIIELVVKPFDIVEEMDDVELVTDETVSEMLIDGKVLVAGEVLVLNITELGLLVDGVELAIAEVELLVGGLLVLLVELETLVVGEEACADDMLEDDELGLPLDVVLGVTEVDELRLPLELLLLDAVLLWSEVVRDIGVDVELFEPVDEDEDDIDDEEVVSFPSVTLVIPPVQSVSWAQTSAQRLLGARMPQYLDWNR